jgi:hypothetical protein
VVAETDSFASRQQAIKFLRGFFDALNRRDWTAVEPCFNPAAALFTAAPDRQLSSFMHWDIAAPMFKDWLEHAPGIGSRKVDDLELMVTDRTAIVNLPSRNRKEPGQRAMILTLDGDGWTIRHLHLTRLGIDLGFRKASG